MIKIITKFIDKTPFIILMCLVLNASLTAQTIAQCDSLIKMGTQSLIQKKYARSLEYASEARNMAESKGWYKELFASTNSIGDTYYYMLNYGEGLNYYRESYTIALKQLEGDSKIIAIKNIAKIYVKENLLIEAKKWYLQAIDTAGENDIRNYDGELYTALGHIDNLLANYGQAKKNILKAIALTTDMPQQQLYARIMLAENDLLQGRASQARALAGELYSNASGLKDKDAEILLLTIIAKSYLNEQQYNEAANTANKALALQPDLEKKSGLFQILSQVYYDAKNYQPAFQYKDSVIAANMELDHIRNGKMLKDNIAALEKKYYIDQVADKDREIFTGRIIMYSVLFILITGASIYVTRLRKRKFIVSEQCQKLTQELAKERNNNLMLGKKMQEQETIASLERDQLKSNLEYIQRKILSQTLYITNKDNDIEEILGSIAKRPAISKDKTITKEITALRARLKAESEWKNFIVHFEEVNQEILQRLKKQHPALTPNDIRFLAYIYMNLSIKEIASILGITPESCRKRKERIVLKLEIPEDSNLYNYISGT